MSAKKNKIEKKRLDQLLVEKGLARSREKAKALIMAGLVVVGDHAVSKAGQPVAVDSDIRLKGDNCPYVSRGGLKLEGALDCFNVDAKGYVCLDIGASTGGFTDCLLKRGAVKSYTLDVGTNQLAWEIRNDERVVWREGFHAKDITREMIDSDFVDLIVIDVSFISLTRILAPLKPFLQEGTQLLAMVKPQFEVGRDKLGKGGVVREESLQLEAVDKVKKFLIEMGAKPEPPCKAPVKGPKGNQEYFLYCKGLTE